MYFLYAMLLFVALMLLVFPLVLVASLWGKVRGGDVIYQLCRVWSDTWLFLIGIRHHNIFESEPHSGRQYIFVANHISYLDIPIILATIRDHRIRVLGKAEMKQIPIFGFIYASSVVMVDRNSPDQRTKSVRILTSVLRKGISVLIFPEGTFNETGQPLKDFYEGAFRIAIDTHTTIKPILFLDTYERMPYQSILRLNPGRSRAVFLDEVPVDGLGACDVSQLKQKVYDQMASKLLQYRASWIKPQSKQEL